VTNDYFAWRGIIGGDMGMGGKGYKNVTGCIASDRSLDRCA
jgi:hypothetical protein